MHACTHVCARTHTHTLSSRAQGAKPASGESCPVRDKGGHKPNSGPRESAGAGPREKWRLLPDSLTSGPRTGGVFKTHYYFY